MTETKHKKKKDLTLIVVLAILMLIPLAIDEMFDQLKAFMRATSSSKVAGHASTGRTGQETSAEACQGASCFGRSPSSIQSPGNGSEGGGSGYAMASTPGSFSGGATSAGLEALAMMERREIEAFNAKMRSRMGSRKGEVWAAIEPGPSNPSRFFPELPKPRYSSGIAMVPAPIDMGPSQEEMERELEQMRRAEQAREIEQMRQALKDAEERSKRPLPPLPPKLVQKPPPPVNITPAPMPPMNPNPQPVEEPAPRIVFQPKPKPVENTRTEKLVEVCGRMVPASRAPTAYLECAPKHVEETKKQEPNRKPASEESDLGGKDEIVFQ